MNSVIVNIIGFEEDGDVVVNTNAAGSMYDNVNVNVIEFGDDDDSENIVVDMNESIYDNVNIIEFEDEDENNNNDVIDYTNESVYDNVNVIEFDEWMN